MSATSQLAPSPLLPIPDALTQFFWDGIAQGELRIQRCQQCRHYIHYPRPICRFCRSRELRGERVSGRATLYSWTISTQAFHPFWVARTPFTVATVELVEQPRLMFLSQIVGCDESELRDGMPLEVSFERVAPELTLPFFRPAGAGATR